uniref:Uncharacterized protein n=1 Tax=Fagus sylvatica TaxID=28930 RepID=A0A2N9J3B4_FAGSY
MLKLEKSVSQTTWIKGHRTQFGEEANAEFNKIGEDALIGLDEAGARGESGESYMQALEESSEVNKLEIEKNEDN